MKEKTKMSLQQRHVFEQMEKGQQYTLEQMAQQNQYNIEAFNRENEYNSPSQQMKRAAAAGLNPMFGLGQQAADQNSAVSGSAPSGSAPSGGPDTDLQRIQNIFGLAGQAAQGVSELTTAFANKKNAQTNETQMAYDAEVKAASAQKMRQEARSLQIENDVKAIHFKDRYQKEIAEIGSRFNANEARALLDRKESEQVFARAMAEISERYSKIDFNNAEREKIITLLPYLVKNTIADTNLKNITGQVDQMEAETNRMNAFINQQKVNIEKELLPYRQKNIKADTFVKNCDGLLKKLNYDIEKEAKSLGLQINDRRQLNYRLYQENRKIKQEIRKIAADADLSETEKWIKIEGVLKDFSEETRQWVNTLMPWKD